MHSLGGFLLMTLKSIFKPIIGKVLKFCLVYSLLVCRPSLLQTMLKLTRSAFPALQKARPFSTDFTKISLTKALSQFPTQQQVSALPDKSSVKITKLKNGLTVASQHKFGMHCTLGGKCLILTCFYETYSHGESGTAL